MPPKVPFKLRPTPQVAYGYVPHATGGHGAPPVHSQELQGVVWMPAPIPPPNCPPGLEYLSQIDQMIIQQKIELVEIIIGFETSNRYEVKNAWGQRIYFAAEDTDCCTRVCCGMDRPFTIKILDNMGLEVIELQRPLRCTSCLFPCCLQELEVHAPPGTPIGYIMQTWHPYLPRFTVQNEFHQDVLKIAGPCIACSCCEDVNFDVLSLDEQTPVGGISKHWTGLAKELFTDTDNFGVQFPLDLDVKIKAVLLGACFLVDFMFFEAGGSGQGRLGVWG